MGKMPHDLMEKYIYTRLGKIREDVLIASKPGIDVSVTWIKDDVVLVSHLDPIVGAVKRIGWLAVHIACNDIATAGVRPRWIMSLILLPEKWDPDMLDTITSDIDQAAKELNVSIIGGHTGYAHGLNRPLVSISAMGLGRYNDILLASMAKPGDSIIVTKGIGLEGTAILASDFKDILLSKGVSEKVIINALKYFNEISVVKEAMALAEAKLVNAMHDATRGGVAEALLEMAYASNTYIEVYEDKMPLKDETRIFAEKLNFDPLWMISSGTLIISVLPENEDKVIKILRDMKISSSVVGKVIRRNKPRVLIHRREGYEETLDTLEPDRDELARIWSEYPRA